MIPVFCKTGLQADSGWGNDERWEITNKEVPNNQVYTNSNDLVGGNRYYPIKIGTKRCYVYQTNNIDKLQNRNIEDLEMMVEHLTCEEQTFWDYFLEEENFKKLIEFGKGENIPSCKEMYSFLPPETINYNRLPEDYETTIHQKREMTIRADIHFGYQYERLKYRIKNAIKMIYIGLLEYSGYKEIETEQFTIADEITFLEHEMLGLEIG